MKIIHNIDRFYLNDVADNYNEIYIDRQEAINAAKETILSKYLGLYDLSEKSPYIKHLKSNISFNKFVNDDM